MIKVHRMNGEEFWINHNKIEVMERVHNTILRLDDDKRYVVQESIEDVVEKIRDFNRSIFILDKKPAVIKSEEEPWI